MMTALKICDLGGYLIGGQPAAHYRSDQWRDKGAPRGIFEQKKLMERRLS